MSHPTGVPIVRKFPFAFNTPNILTGASLYTPTIGDILLDAWIEIDTAWDGMTPLGDVGLFLSHIPGLFQGAAGAAVPMNVADTLIHGEGPLGGQSMNDLHTADALGQSLNGVAVLPVPVAGASLTLATPSPFANGVRVVPSKFQSANPIKVVVSQDGTTTGGDPGSTVGSAILYLVTATPA